MHNWNNSCYFVIRNQKHKDMTTLTLTPKTKNTGLGCLNGISCPICKAPMLDTLSGEDRPIQIKDAFCPMCDYSAPYNAKTKTIIR